MRTAAGRERHRAPAELFGARASRDRGHHRARSVEQGHGNLRRLRVSARRHVLAPRIFSTGDVVYGAHSEGFASIETLEDARNHIQRLKAQGAISIKNYNQPRRDQRQMVVTAAREAGMLVVPEGGSLYQWT